MDVKIEIKIEIKSIWNCWYVNVMVFKIILIFERCFFLIIGIG